MTGLKRSEVVGKNVTQVHPEIKKLTLDWIGVYGKLSQGGEAIRFEHYFEPSKRWYEVCAYSDEPGYFVAVFRDINKYKNMEINLHDMSGRLKAIIDNNPLLISELCDSSGRVSSIGSIAHDITDRIEVEKALRESEEKLSHILNNMTDVVWSISWPDFRHIYHSPSLEKLYGRSAQEFNDNPALFKEVTHPEDQHLTEKAIEQLLEEGQATRECRVVKPDGSIIWINDRSKLIYDENNQPIRVEGVTQDITERKHFEQELSRSEERFQKMLSLVPDLISIHDTDMNIVYSNWNGFGDVPEEKRILNTKCYYTYRGLDQNCPDCQAVTVLQTGEAFQKEVELFEGTWVDLRVIPILGENHTVELFVEWVRDISERKKSEKEIIAQQKLLEGIMDNVSDVLSIQYPDHTIERYNRAGYELLGMTPEEVRGKKCHQLIGKARECEECATGKALQSGKLEQLEKYFPELGIHLDCRANPVFKDGKIVWVVQHLRDITERKNFEQALKLQASERAAVDTFTYSVSNDLQAPLRRIEGFSEALLEECPDQLSDQAQGYLNRIITQIGSMKNLTDALLQLSRVVSHRMEREAVDLSALIRSNLEKLQYKEPERRVETVVAPKLIVEGDADLLKILLANLLDNAWKFSAGEKEARIEFGSKEQDGRTVYYLKDNGAGFDMNHAEKLFVPFHKLHSENEYSGIGIGLNLVYRIISRHSGEIWAEGEPGKGACFFFTLP